MEVLFENTFLRTKKVAKEMYGYFYFRRIGMNVCYLFFGVFFILGVYNFFVYKHVDLIFLLTGPIVYLFQIFLYCYQVNSLVRRDEELFGGPTTIKSVVTEDSVRALAPSGGTNEVAYNNVRRAIQTENLIFLQTKANLLYVFLKDGFTLGTAEEFIAFLKSKGVRVK